VDTSGSEPQGATRYLPDDFRESLDEVIRRSDKPAYRIVATRTLRLLAQKAGALRVDALADAADEPSDFDALLRLLEILSPPAEPFFPARLRGIRIKRELLGVEGAPLISEEVAAHLGVTRQAVNKRRAVGRLLAVPTGRKGLQYPSWQFTEGGVLPGLEGVLQALEGLDAWSQIRFFLTGDARLGGARPLDELRDGRVERVIRAAQAFGEHGAA
jgi:hypothetical protein